MANTSPGKAILSLLVKTKIPKSIGQPLLLVQNCEFYKNGSFDLCIALFLGGQQVQKGLTDGS